MSDTIPPTVPETVPPTVEPAATPSEDDLLREAGLLPPEEPAAPDETEIPTEETAPAEPADDTPPAPAPAEPAPVAEVAPVSQSVQHQANAAAAQRDQRLAEIKYQIQQLRAVPEADRDAFEHSGKMVELLAEKDSLRDFELADLRQSAAEVRAVAQEQQFWRNWEKQNGDIGAKRGQEIWEEEAAKFAKKYPNVPPDQYQIAAIESFESRLKLSRAQRAAKTPTPAPAKGPPITPGGGRITPATAAPRPAVTSDPEDDFVNTFKGGAKEFARG